MRKLDFNIDTDWECGGKHFYITDSLGFIRYKKSQEFMLEFGFSMSFLDIYHNLEVARDYFDKGQYYNMAVTHHKIMEGVKNINDKDDPALRLCALFINEKDEDLTKYDEAQMKAKINCWASELEVSPFFYLAANLMKDWTNAYQKLILNGSIPKETEQ
jgi:hypothetical protein